jgi:hypothetical protein
MEVRPVGTRGARIEPPVIGARGTAAEVPGAPGGPSGAGPRGGAVRTMPGWAQGEEYEPIGASRSGPPKPGEMPSSPWRWRR